MQHIIIVTKNGLKELAYEIRKILCMVSQQITGTRHTNRGGSQNENTVDNFSACSWVRVYPAHIEEGSQVTLQWERLHHNFMHDLRNPRNRLVSKRAAVRT